MATGTPATLKHYRTIRFLSDPLRGLPKFNLAVADWNKASDPSEDYNCFGFAVGVFRWWSPPDVPDLISNVRDYWPAGLPKGSRKIDAFVAAARGERFDVCADGQWVEGKTKIVLCFDDDDHFTHAAIQISPDRWKSKFGQLSDISHALNEIDGCDDYGSGRIYLVRDGPPHE